MKITCDTCGSHYKIADEKVRGRRVKVKCKSCGKTLVVDGANEAAPASPASAAGGAAAAGADAWSINLSETDQRSMTTNEIADGCRAGWISKDAYVWREGMAEWQPLTQVPELRDAIGPSSTRSASVPPAAAAPASQPPAAAAFPVPGNGSAAQAGPKAAARASVKRAGGDLFGRAASAGSEEEQAAAPASAPLMAGTQPYDDPKPTGARNENSVLFSLDALKVGFGAPSSGAPSPAPAPAPKGKPPPRQQVASNPDDPFGMGGNDSLAGIGGAGFGFGANQALLTAPAPPEPKPLFKLSADPVVGAAAALAPLPSRRGPSKVLIFGGIVAILAVVGIVIASSGGEKQDEAEASSASTELKAAQKPAEKPPEAKKEEPKPEEKAEEKKPESKVASATKAGDVKRPADSTKAKTEATEKVATKTDEKPAVKQQPSDGVSTFNKGAAIAALSSSAAAASSCKRPGGPTGTGRAVVTFAPSGRVTTVNITGGEFGGSSVGSCIASVFRRASVPAFSGSPVTVSKSFSISQ
jgi:predicted Zn finger-like uncharacterized protein